MMPPIDNQPALAPLRELPAEVSLDQVGQMVAAFPLVVATASWLSALKLNLNSILMTTTAGTILIGGGLYLFSPEPAPATPVPEPPAPVTIEAVETPIMAAEPAVVFTAEPEKRSEPPKPSAPEPAAAIVAAEPDAPAEADLEPVLIITTSLPEPPHEATPLRVLRKNEGERSFDLSGFTGVSLRSSVDVLVEQGPFSVRAVGEEEALERLRVEVKGGTLTVDQDSKRFTPGSCNTAVRVEVRMPKVNSLEVLGSGTMKAGRFDEAGQLVLTLRGSGDLVLDGVRQAGSLSIRLDGSGDVACQDIAVSGLTTIGVAGSGDVVVAGRTKGLEIDLVGSGDIATPGMRSETCKVRLVGSGDVIVGGSGSLEREVVGSGELHVQGSGAGSRPRGVGANVQ